MSLQLKFLGANRQVTGSRYALSSRKTTLLVDCGLFQERPFLHRNWDPDPIDPRQIDALLLTHAHVDHCGLIPRLVQRGFKSPIYCTPATADLAEIILRDAAGIQSEDAAYKRRRHEKENRRGPYEEEPLYTLRDVERALPLFKTIRYGKPLPLPGGFAATWFDAGHILGSAMIEVRHENEEGKTTRVLFSGDIGQNDMPLVHNPTTFHSADVVVMESTYGDREHRDGGDIETQLARAITETLDRGGNVIIPTFAVERAQQLTYYLSRLVHAKRIPRVPVFLDSPMAVDAMEVFARHRQNFDADTWAMITAGQSPLHFPGFRMTRTPRESQEINNVRGGAVIMATSGMCNAGRIKHHLRHNISRPEATVLFVGYQSHGTLGRQIVDGDAEVRIHGKMCEVKADIRQIYGFSGHADRTGLLDWIGALEQPPRQIYLTHGEETAALALADEIRARWNWHVEVPEYGATVALET